MSSFFTWVLEIKLRPSCLAKGVFRVKSRQGAQKQPPLAVICQTLPWSSRVAGQDGRVCTWPPLGAENFRGGAHSELINTAISKEALNGYQPANRGAAKSRRPRQKGCDLSLPTNRKFEMNGVWRSCSQGPLTPQAKSQSSALPCPAEVGRQQSP